MIYIAQLVLVFILTPISMLYPSILWTIPALILAPGSLKGTFKLAKAFNDANNFEPVIRPRTLWVNTRTNEWGCGKISDSTLWWRVFLNSVNGRQL